MNNDLISRSELTKELRERLVACNDWEEKAKDKETRIRANAVKTFICEMFLLLKEFPTVELQPIKVNVPEDIKDKLIEELSKPRKVILDEPETVTDCIIAYGDGFESARRLFERPHGKWIDPQNVGANNWCSVCGEFILHYEGISNYCPNCGADMRKGEEE